MLLVPAAFAELRDVLGDVRARSGSRSASPAGGPPPSAAVPPAALTTVFPAVAATGFTRPPNDLRSVASCALTAAGFVSRHGLQIRSRFFIGHAAFPAQVTRALPALRALLGHRPVSSLRVCAGRARCLASCRDHVPAPFPFLLPRPAICWPRRCLRGDDVRRRCLLPRRPCSLAAQLRSPRVHVPGARHAGDADQLDGELGGVELRALRRIERAPAANAASTRSPRQRGHRQSAAPILRTPCASALALTACGLALAARPSRPWRRSSHAGPARHQRIPSAAARGRHHGSAARTPRSGSASSGIRGLSPGRLTRLAGQELLDVGPLMRETLLDQVSDVTLTDAGHVRSRCRRIRGRPGHGGGRELARDIQPLSGCGQPDKAAGIGLTRSNRHQQW